MSSLYQSPSGLARGTLLRRGLPVTAEGRWSLRLVAAGIVLVAIGRVTFALTGTQALAGPVPLHGVVALVGVLAILQGGILALVAIARRGERSIFVLATLPVWLIPVVFVVADLPS